MNLRRARSEEAELLTALAIRSKRAWGYGDDFMEKVMPDMIVHRRFLDEEHGTVAELEGAVLGYAIVKIDGKEALLRDLFVEPEHFRKGIGKSLFEEALRFARDRGATRMKLFGDPNAVGFYESLGMQKIGDQPSIVDGGRTLPIMAIEL